MAETPGDKTSQIATWFWVVGGVALIWNLLGLMAFVMQLMLTDDIIAQLPVEQQELYKNMPAWATAAFGVAVVCGVLGCVALLMRKSGQSCYSYCR